MEAQLFRERGAARAAGAKSGARAAANGLAKNESAGAPVRVARRLRVLSPEDISVGGDEFSTVTLVTSEYPPRPRLRLQPLICRSFAAVCRALPLQGLSPLARL